MSGTGHRLLGLLVWRGGRWYLRQRYGRLVPSRRRIAVGGLTALAAGLALLRRRRPDRTDTSTSGQRVSTS